MLNVPQEALEGHLRRIRSSAHELELEAELFEKATQLPPPPPTPSIGTGRARRMKIAGAMIDVLVAVDRLVHVLDLEDSQ